MVETYTNCLHQYREDKRIHTLVLQNGSIAAVNDGLAHFARILGEHPQHETLYLLVDVRAGIPPLTYFLRELRRTYNSQSNVPPLRIVYLYRDTVIMSALSASLATLPVNATRHALQNGTEQEAVDWLLASDK